MSMFDDLEEIRESWEDSKFIIIINEQNEGGCYFILPAQATRWDHIEFLRKQNTRLLGVGIPHDFANIIDFPFYSVILEGIKSRYPRLQLLSNGNLPQPLINKLSITLSKVEKNNLPSDRQVALTISGLGDVIDDYENSNMSRESLLRRVSEEFMSPGYTTVYRGSHGLLKKDQSIIELGIALTTITNFSGSITFALILDNKGEIIEPEMINEKKYADIPKISSSTVINLWRSIKKVSKNDINFKQ